MKLRKECHHQLSMQRMTEGKIISHITMNVSRRQRIIKIKLSDAAFPNL